MISAPAKIYRMFADNDADWTFVLALDLPTYGTKYFHNRSIIPGEEAGVLSWSTLERRMVFDPREWTMEFSALNITMSREFGKYVEYLTNTTARLYIHIGPPANPVDVNMMWNIWTGVVQSVSGASAGIELEILDIAAKFRKLIPRVDNPGTETGKFSRSDNGTAWAQTWRNIPDGVIGSAKPVIVGDVKRWVPPCINEGGRTTTSTSISATSNTIPVFDTSGFGSYYGTIGTGTTLTADISAQDSSISVASTAGFGNVGYLIIGNTSTKQWEILRYYDPLLDPGVSTQVNNCVRGYIKLYKDEEETTEDNAALAFPSSSPVSVINVIQVNDEVIAYGSVSATQFGALLRGLENSAADSHPANSQVSEYHPVLAYMIANHECKSTDTELLDSVIFYDPEENKQSGTRLTNFYIERAASTDPPILVLPDRMAGFKLYATQITCSDGETWIDMDMVTASSEWSIPSNAIDADITTAATWTAGQTGGSANAIKAWRSSAPIASTPTIHEVWIVHMLDSNSDYKGRGTESYVQYGDGYKRYMRTDNGDPTWTDITGDRTTWDWTDGGGLWSSTGAADHQLKLWASANSRRTTDLDLYEYGLLVRHDATNVIDLYKMADTRVTTYGTYLGGAGAVTINFSFFNALKRLGKDLEWLIANVKSVTLNVRHSNYFAITDTATVQYGDGTVNNLTRPQTTITTESFDITSDVLDEKSIEMPVTLSLDSVTKNDMDVYEVWLEIVALDHELDPQAETICVDVKGVPDDLEGTYTGTSKALIENPADAMHATLAVITGITGGNINTDSFELVRTQLSDDSIDKFGGVIYEPIDSHALLVRMCQQSGCYMFCENGKFKLWGGINHIDTSNVVMSFDENNIVQDSFSWHRQNLYETIHHLNLYYNEDYAKSTWSVYQKGRLTSRGGERKTWRSYLWKFDTDINIALGQECVYELEANLINDDNVAQGLLDKVVDNYGPIRTVISFNTLSPLAALLERGDVIEFTHNMYPHKFGRGCTNKQFFVTLISVTEGEPVHVEAISVETYPAITS